MSVFFNLSGMDYFGVAGLPDEMILHLASFCTGSDLLNLSVTSQRLNQLLGTSREMISKIRLVINGFEDLDVEGISKFVLTRKFKVLKIVGFELLFPNGRKEEGILTLLETVVETSAVLIIEKSRLEESTMKLLIRSFLSDVDELHFNDVDFDQTCQPQSSTFVSKYKTKFDTPIDGIICRPKGQQTEKKVIDQYIETFLQGPRLNNIKFLVVLSDGMECAVLSGEFSHTLWYIPFIEYWFRPFLKEFPLLLHPGLHPKFHS